MLRSNYNFWKVPYTKNGKNMIAVFYSKYNALAFKELANAKEIYKNYAYTDKLIDLYDLKELRTQLNLKLEYWVITERGDRFETLCSDYKNALSEYKRCCEYARKGESVILAVCTHLREYCGDPIEKGSEIFNDNECAYLKEFTLH